MRSSDHATGKARVPIRLLPHFAFCILHGFFLAACGSEAALVQVSDSRSGAYEAALATDEAGFAVAWYDTRDGNPEIYMRLLDATGQPSGPERRLTDTPEASYEASLERLGDAFVVAWYEQSTGGQQTAMLGGWTRDGTRRWQQTIATSSRNPVIRVRERTIVAAWIQTAEDGREAVWVGTWGEDGQELGARIEVGPASKTTWNVNLALDGSSAWVAFDAAASTKASELFLGRVEASGARLERLTRDDGAESKYPDITISEQGRVALTWYDMRDGNDEVYLFVGGQSDLHTGIDDRARRITTTAGESIGTYGAWNQDRVGLAWSDKTPGAHEVYFQWFDGSGMPLGSAQRVTRTDPWSLVPAIRSWREGFALAWTEYRPASSQLHGGTGEIGFAVVR